MRKNYKCLKKQHVFAVIVLWFQEIYGKLKVNRWSDLDITIWVKYCVYADVLTCVYFCILYI